jgi:hypothetical protein
MATHATAADADTAGPLQSDQEKHEVYDHREKELQTSNSDADSQEEEGRVSWA